MLFEIIDTNGNIQHIVEHDEWSDAFMDAVLDALEDGDGEVIPAGTEVTIRRVQ